MSAFDSLLERNRAFAANTAQGRPLTAMPANQVFVITCLDPRVEPSAVLGVGLGDAIVLRNPGGRATSAAIADVALISFMGEFMGAQGPPLEIAVLHHTQCGTGLLADDDFRRAFRDRTGLDERALLAQVVLDPDVTVRQDVASLLQSPMLTDRVVVSGHVLDLDTGLIRTVLPAVAVTTPSDQPLTGFGPHRAGRMTLPAIAPDPPSEEPSSLPHQVVVPARRPGLVLGVVLLATFVINLDTTIVNVALPALTRQLHASTSGLQWVIDAYNLAFAGLILIGGTVADRYGRRRTLIAGLLVFAAGSGLAATVSSTGGLIGWRIVVGAAAAFIFPTTLSIISQTFPDRADRAKAIGAWGAATGVAVAVGPIAGGELLAHFWWGSIFLAMVPVALITLAGALAIVPKDRTIPAAPLDFRGLVLSAVALTALVYTIIEAPARGWGSPSTLVGLIVAVAGFAGLIRIENRLEHPMLDVRLFTNLRFTAASGAVTTAFFALFGFTFLIILYFQVMRGYSALEAGVRILPVAGSLAVASGIGTVLAVRIGNKIVVSVGLLMVALGYLWVALAQTAGTSYGTIVLQMILLGGGMGLSTAPATEAILGVVKPEQAGIGSAVNDATRLVGGTLGVAIVGSTYSSLYRHHLHGLRRSAARDLAESSYPASRAAAERLPTAAAHQLLSRADAGFLHGLPAGCGVAAGACLLGALVVLAFLPAHPTDQI